MGKHYAQLTAEERAAIIMMMKESNSSARKIALTLRRALSTINHELYCFGAPFDHPSSPANSPKAYDARADGLRTRSARFKCCKRSILASNTVLFVWCSTFCPRVGAIADCEHTQAHVALLTPSQRLSRNHR